ncbi:MAG: SDR family oxidoreductase [Desulfobacterales bacterium]
MSDQKKYIVVGGSSGIGFALSRKLAADGHQVIVFSRSLGALEALPEITHVPCDVLRDPFPKERVPKKLNGLAYCPGSIKLRPIGRLSHDDFLEDFRINLLGAVTVIQNCLMPLKKSDQQSAIVLFSTVAVQTGMPFHASVASAKGAVEGLTRSLAAELVPRVRVNAVAPSLTDTPMAQALLADEDKRSAAAQRHPLKRTGTPDELAAAAHYLLSDASAWMTGQIMAVDGGMGSLRTFN